MGSVIDMIQCPNCGQEAYLDFYYKTGEEYTSCNSCGYNKSITIIDREKPLTEDNYSISELSKPFGAFRIKTYDSVGTLCGSFSDESQYNQFKNQVINDSQVECASVSRLIGTDIHTEIIVDNGPKYDSAGFTQEDNNSI